MTRPGWLGLGLAAVAIALLAGCEGAVAEDSPSAGAGAGGSAGASAGAGAGAGAGGGAGASAGTGASAGSGGAGAGAGAGAGRGGAGGNGGGGSAGDAAGDAGVDATVDAGMEPVDSPCPSGVSFGDPLPPSQQRTAMLLQGGFDFLEGPVWLAEQGVLFFSDMHMGGNPVPPATIVRFTPPSTFEPFVDDGGCNGLALTRQGDLLACTHDVQTLSIFDADDGERTTLDLTYMGDHFNSPNDLTVRSDGTIYFTDPDWQLGDRESETGMTGVYRLPPGSGATPVLVDGSLDKPNGIALSPDEQTLYVTSAGADLMAYPISADGSTGAGSVLASPGGSDGLAVDCAGNLYVTAGSVRVFDPQGDEVGSISVAESPANVAFGGSERRTLYITARTSLYAIELNVPGYPY